jgi:hypothetical protein
MAFLVSGKDAIPPYTPPNVGRFSETDPFPIDVTKYG